MARWRSCESFSFKNANFIAVVLILVLSFALFIYEYFIVEQRINAIFFLILALYLLAMWSYVASVVVNAGAVPVYLGLYTEDQPGERRYCLLCHNFKPERCHHCSKCQQCVLNMDHHCPWINNCVGFDNRKYFLLFISYLLLAIVLAVVWMVVILVGKLKDGTFIFDLHMILKLILFVKYVFLFFLLSFFTLTHYNYVLNNLTTIEDMLMKRKTADRPTPGATHNPYDINPYYNFTQVFGDNPFYWLFPIASEQPLKGAGIKWDKNKGFFNPKKSAVTD